MRGRLKGWVTISERAPDGTVRWERTVPNIIPNWGVRTWWPIGYPYGGASLYFAADARPAAIQDGSNHLKGDLQTPILVVSPTVTYTPGTLTVKFSGVIAAPSAPPRTISKIGLGTPYFGGSPDVFPMATVLDLTPVVQQGAAPLTLDYYLQMNLPLGAGLKRWDFTNSAALRHWAHLTFGSLASQLWTGLKQDVTYGDFFSVDPEARYGGDPYRVGSQWLLKDVNAVADSRRCARGPGIISFTTAHVDNNIRVGPLTAIMQASDHPWLTNDVHPPVGASVMTACWASKPLALRDGTVSQVFKHPVGEVLLYNGAGGATSLGAMEALGPYRPDNMKIPRSFGCRAIITASGDTDPGTEGTYVMERGEAIRNTALTSVQSEGQSIYDLFPGYTAMDPIWWAANPPTAIAADGRGGYWLSAKQQTVFGAPTDRAVLLYWKGGTNEQVHSPVEQDITRFYGLTGGNELILGHGYQAIFGHLCPPALASDGDGRIFWPKRDVAAGSQAIYVIDNRKPGRQIQRPSGMALGGTQTFKVRADDEVHAMFPFVAGDVNAVINIVDGPNAGEHLIQAVNGSNEVTLSTTMLTDLDVKWHWKLVTERSSADGLVAKPRVLLFDQANGRLWAFVDGGIQVSTDHGATWSAIINASSGLSTTDAENAMPPDGFSGNQTAVVSKAGDIYWIDSMLGINKYVGAGPGGTHSRITAFPGTGGAGGYGPSGITLDNVACHMPTAEGALWICAGYQPSVTSVWRINLDVAFTSGNLAKYEQGIELPPAFGPIDGIIPGSGGFVHFRQLVSAQYAKWDPATDTVAASGPTDFQYSSAPHNTGATHVDADGMICSVSAPINFGGSFLFHDHVRYLWDDIAEVWRPWSGSGAQFNARYGTTNGGNRKLHATWEPFRDNIRTRFVQTGGAPASEFVVGESFSYVGAWGLLRDNTQDFDLSVDSCFAKPVAVLEEDTRRTVQGRGALTAYYAADNVTPVTTQAAAPLGSGTLPAVQTGGRHYGWLPRRFSGLTVTNGPVPETFGTTAALCVVAGLDLGAAQEVAKLRVHVQPNTSSPAYPRLYSGGVDTDEARIRVHHSDDNVSWTEIPSVRLIGGYVTPPTEPDPAYTNVDIEHDDGGSVSGADFTWQGYTFDLLRAGLSSAARTHRYWKVVFATGYAEAGAPNLSNHMMGSICALNAAGQAIGVADDLFLSEMLDPDVLASQVLSLAWIQDRVGLSGKGGINTAPDALADGWTNQAAIASGTFSTGDINPATDWLAYRHPVTGKFLLPGAEELGAAHVRGGTTMVRITAATSGLITVAGRVLPDNLAAVDWEVRRPAAITDQFPSAGGVGCDPSGGYLSFHDTDIGREFRILARVVVRRP